MDKNTLEMMECLFSDSRFKFKEYLTKNLTIPLDYDDIKNIIEMKTKTLNI